jgi:tetratricopeptide (TPR) repeat protein
VLAVFLVYQPAWRGGFIWDDDAHVTKPELRSWHGLYRIWFELGATQQYYPLLHSAFWVEHNLWGDATLGYHLVNILLHAAAAVLVALVLRRLSVPGAYLAAALFALHPVHVESVAWITEQKNTLSAVFYLGAMLVYLRFDQARKTSLYWWALGLFVLGLMSKTTAAALPAALLVIFWWQRGRLSWHRDVRPLAPFFVLGLLAGLLTAWVERKLIGAEGAAFDLTLVERCLLAGRAIWFYLGKLFWPTDLIFIYPRWQVSQAVWWQYLFPAAALLLLAGLWALRRRWRGPLAGLLFFVGTLLPALGFCNVYPFLYSFVADHFQYLASLGVITLASAGVALLLGRWGLWRRPAGYAACLALLATLGTLTWRQSRMYSDIDMLYLTTIDRNPGCGMAYNNLGMILQSRAKIDEAMAYYQKAMKFQPNYAPAHANFGAILGARGQFDAAMACYRKALEIQPGFVVAHNNMGELLARQGRFEEAMAHYQKALEIRPDYAMAHNNLGNILAAGGRLDEATVHYRKALKLRPDYAMAHNNLGNALAHQGRFEEALTEYHKALEIQPNFVLAHDKLGDLLAARGQFPEALAHYRKAMEIEPADPMVQRSLAWLLATCPLASLRNGAEAMTLAERANRLSGGQRPEVLDTLAAAYAEAGWFAEAQATARKALELAIQQNNRVLASGLRDRIALYEARRPYRQASPVPTPSP